MIKKKLPTKENYKQNIFILSESLSLGFRLSIAPIFFSLLGIYLDKKFQSLPLLTVFFVFIGIIVSVFIAIKTAAYLNKK